MSARKRPDRVGFGIMAAAALAMLTSLATTARAANTTVQFVTVPGNCANHIDNSGNGADPQLQAGTTSIELWADFIENASTITASASDVSATVLTRRNGLTNAARGCPLKGSIEIQVNSPQSAASDLLRVLTVHRSDNADTFTQQVKFKAIPQFDLTFKGTASFTCLGQLQFLENNKRLQIQLPQGHLTDLSNCSAPLTLLIGIPAPVPFVHVTDTYHYSLSSALSRLTLVATGGGAAGATGPGGVPIRLTGTLTPLYVPVANAPALFTPPPPPLPTAIGYPPSIGTTIQLDALGLRKTTVSSRLTLTAKTPNGLTSSVNVDILPAPAPSGIASAAASPQTVDVSNLVDITAILANAAPTGGEVITYKVGTPACFQLDSGAALPTTRGIAGVGTVTIPAGAGALPGVTLVTLRANNTDSSCVGVGSLPTSAVQRVDLYIGDFVADPTVLNLPLGPNHAQVSFSVRRQQ